MKLRCFQKHKIHLFVSCNQNNHFLGLNPHATVPIFFLHQLRLLRCSFFIHSTTPYIHPRLDSRIEPTFSDWPNVLSYLWSEPSSSTIVCVGEQLRLWLDCAHSQASLSLGYSLKQQVLKAYIQRMYVLTCFTCLTSNTHCYRYSVDIFS